MPQKRFHAEMIGREDDDDHAQQLAGVKKVLIARMRKKRQVNKSVPQ